MFSPPVALALYSPSSVFQKLYVETLGNRFDHLEGDLEVAHCVSLTGGREMAKMVIFLINFLQLLIVSLLFLVENPYNLALNISFTVN